jgi:membrane associated rhomboid family serine protease
MLIPISDDNPRYSTPIVNYLLIGLNTVIFLFTISSSLDIRPDVLDAYGMKPATYLQEPLTLLTSMFLHANIFHIAGNMLFLWIVGDNVEDALGHAWYLVAYLLGGIAADLLYVAFSTPAMAQTPAIGASGAISAMMGFYVVVFPQIRVRILFFLTWWFVRTFWARAFWVIGGWFAMQLLYWGLTAGQMGGGVAYGAHVGGFVFGAGLAVVLRMFLPKIDPHRRHGVERPVAPARLGFGGPQRGVRAGVAPMSDVDIAFRSPRNRGYAYAPPATEPEVELVGSAENMERTIEQRLLSGQAAGAARVWNGYLRAYPNRPMDAMLQLNLVQALERVQDHATAAACLEHFLVTRAQDVNAPEAALALGMIYARHLGNAARARLMLGAAAAQHPVPDRAALARQELQLLR